MAAAETGPSAPLDALVQAAALHLQADLRWLDYVETLARTATQNPINQQTNTEEDTT